MVSEVLPINIYRLFCPKCLKEKQRSRTFRSFRQLKWHVNHLHQDKTLHQIIDKIENNIASQEILDEAVELGVIRL